MSVSSSGALNPDTTTQIRHASVKAGSFRGDMGCPVSVKLAAQLLDFSKWSYWWSSGR